MPSGKKSKQQRRLAAQAPPPVRSKGMPANRQANPKVLLIGGGIAAVVAVVIVLAIVLSGGGSGTPKVTQTIGSAASGLPGATDVASMFKGIPQNGLFLGSPAAPVQMVIYIDLQCPICQNFETTITPGLVSKYIRTGKVRLEVKPWAFIGPDSTRGQKAMFAAADQNKAFEFSQVLYDNQGTENTGWLNDSMIVQIAESVTGLNVPKLLADRNSAKVKQEIAAVASAAVANKVTGTPTVFVGRTGSKPALVGSPGSAPDLTQVTQALDTALAG
ncbi:MAG TPA: thioredoxin domain-containing protein [Gaiellaceae bacterium]|jgi:protein-disulfide isomerase|nr:thioredoxin domain-containing protein [Gaiellaceae bacterium]